MDLNKLKGVLREKNKTYEDCSNVLDLSVTGFSNKMNGKSSFDIIEINRLVKYLDLDKRQAADIFLSDNLHEMKE